MGFLVSLFTTPNATTTLTNVADYSGALFDSLLPLVYIAVGFIVAGLFVSYLIGRILAGVKNVTGGKRGGRRGRRGR